MSDQPYWNQTYTLADGETLPVIVEGAYFRLIASTGDLSIRVDNAPAYPVPVAIGIHIPDGFDRLQVVNRSGGSVVFTLAIAEGAISDDRLSVSGTLATKEVKSATLPTTADVTLGAASADLISAANAARRSIMVSNDTGADIRIGDANVGAGQGLRIPNNAIAILDTAAALYGFSVLGGNVSLTEVED